MANIGKRIGSKPDWRPFEKVFGKRDGFESEFILPRRWDGADIYSDLNKLLADYSDAVKESRSSQSHKELEDRIDKVCGSVLEMLRLYLHGYPSEAYAVMKALMEKLDEDPLYIDGSDVKSLYRMSSVKENIDDKPRIFHAPYNIRPKIRTYRYSIAGYPSLYLAESLELAEEEMHLFRDKKPAIAARFEFDKDFAEQNLTKILEFGVRPQDLASPEDDKKKNAPEGGAEKDGEENAQAKNTPEGSAEKDVNEKAQEETIRGKFEDSVRRAEYIKKKFARQPGMPEAADRTAKAGLPAPERYMLWYPLIAACSYVRTNREDPFAPEYIVPQLLAQWMRSENTGELVGIRYFSCYSRHASEKGRNYVFPSSGDPIVLKDGVRQYCPVLNEAFAFTGTEYLPEYAEVGALQKALEIKVAERAFRLTREDYKEETKVELPAQLMYVAARSFMWCEKLKSADNMDGVVSIGDMAFYGCERLALEKLPKGLKSIGALAFAGCERLVLEKLPEGLKSIGAWAFYGCERLALERLPEGLESIGALAFYGCERLALEKLPEGLKSIGAFAFENCNLISEITLPEGLTELGFGVFDHCTGLRKIRYNGSREQWKRIIIESSDGDYWDYGAPDYTFCFADGELTKKELHELEGLPDPEGKATDAA